MNLHKVDHLAPLRGAHIKYNSHQSFGLNLQNLKKILTVFDARKHIGIFTFLKSLQGFWIPTSNHLQVLGEVLSRLDDITLLNLLNK